MPCRPEEGREQAPSRTRPCILLIEDNRADAGLVREALEHHAVAGELLVVTDGQSAIDLIRTLEDCPSLIIVDLNLPRRSGRDVLAFLRDQPRYVGTPVVVLSSSDTEEDRAESAALGVHRYLRKPSRLAEFLELGRVFKTILSDYDC